MWKKIACKPLRAFDVGEVERGENSLLISISQSNPSRQLKSTVVIEGDGPLLSRVSPHTECLPLEYNIRTLSLVNSSTMSICGPSRP